MKLSTLGLTLALTFVCSAVRAQEEAPLEEPPAQDLGTSPLPEAPSFEESPSQPVVTKPAPAKAKTKAKAKAKGKKKPVKKKPGKKKKRGALETGGRGLASVGVGGEMAYVVPVEEPAVVPTAVTVVETDVYGERTSFEKIVKERRDAARNPAGLKVAARVIAVRRELGLTRQQADQAPQDIILNGGEKSGLSEGMTLSIVRRVPILDPYRENQQSEIEIKYGKIKIVHVQEDVAIARVERIDSIRDGLAMGVRGPLVGDFVGK